MTTTTTTTARAIWRDGCGNTLKLTVRGDRVSLTNQHGISLRLNAVMFISGRNGYAEQNRALREAVKGAKDSGELVHKARMATRISGWVAA